MFVTSGVCVYDTGVSQCMFRNGIGTGCLSTMLLNLGLWTTPWVAVTPEFPVHISRSLIFVSFRSGRDTRVPNTCVTQSTFVTFRNGGDTGVPQYKYQVDEDGTDDAVSLPQPPPFPDSDVASFDSTHFDKNISFNASLNASINSDTFQNFWLWYGVDIVKSRYSSIALKFRYGHHWRCQIKSDKLIHEHCVLQIVMFVAQLLS